MMNQHYPTITNIYRFSIILSSPYTSFRYRGMMVLKAGKQALGNAIRANPILFLCVGVFI